MCNFKLLTASALLAFAAAGAHAGGEKKATYRWVDANGQVHFGDKIPPQDAKQGRARINNQGVVTKVVPRELHGAELEAAEARAKAEREAADLLARQVAYDRYLVQAYASVADIQATRSERLVAIDSRAALTQKAVTDIEKTLTGLRTRASDAGVARQIENYEQSLIENLQASKSLRDERTATEQKFASDIDRYKRLKAGSLQPGG